jgi:hypothetical protein
MPREQSSPNGFVGVQADDAEQIVAVGVAERRAGDVTYDVFEIL